MKTRALNYLLSNHNTRPLFMYTCQFKNIPKFTPFICEITQPLLIFLISEATRLYNPNISINLAFKTIFFFNVWFLYFIEEKSFILLQKVWCHLSSVVLIEFKRSTSHLNVWLINSRINYILLINKLDLKINLIRYLRELSHFTCYLSWPT